MNSTEAFEAGATTYVVCPFRSHDARYRVTILSALQPCATSMAGHIQ
jgi:hypothetical protein